MLRLALCGFAKSHQGGFGAICQVQTGAAVFAKQSPYAGTHGQGPQDLQALHPWQCFASQLRQQALYSQESNSSNKSEQSVARAQQHVNKRGSSHAAEGNPSSAPSSTSNTSSNGSKQGAESRPSRNGGSDSSNSRKPYIGATTAAQHNMRNSVPVPGLQSEAPGKQSRQHQQQQTAVLKQPDHSKHSGQYQHASSGDKITSRQRAQQTEQYYQQKAGAAFQKHNPQQQQQYKVVQYSRGTSLLLALSTDDGGGYVLQKTNGPASAADLAAFGRTKPAKDGAAAAPKPVKEVPLLLRPFQRYLERVKKVLQATFLPSGYPTSVGSNYLEYTLWQAVTNFATTANGVLASTFLLYSVGLGAGAIPTAGALNWVLKDGLGQMGTLLFGKAIAHNFDIHSKTWYFMSFLLLSTATGLEIATILVPQAFLVLGSCANMIKGLSWMAGGSTRSVFNLSFVRDNNIADITAKNTSQYIFASLFGTAAGVSCCAYIGQSAPLALLCFSGLAYTSMYSAYRTVKAIPLPTLNSTRLQLLAARYLKCVRTSASDGFPGVLSYERQHGFMSFQHEYEVPEDEDDTCELELPSPLDMAEMDNPLPWVVGDPRLLNPGIHVGTQLDRLVEGQPAMLVVVLNTFRYSRYLLVPERNAIHLVLHAEAQPRDMVQAYLQACILRKCLKTGQSLSPDNLPELRIILHDTLLAAENLTPPFMRALARQGWQTEKIVVEAHRRRARW